MYLTRLREGAHESITGVESANSTDSDAMRELTLPDGRASAALFGSGETVVVLGHGAGGNRKNPMLVALATSLAESGRAALLYNFPYTEARARRPDPPGGARGDHPRRRRARARGERGAAAIVHGGRSMGGRIASQVVAQGEPADGLVVPRLPAPSARPVREAARSAPAADRGADALPAGNARRLRARGPARRADGAPRRPAELHRVAHADHSFGVLKRSGRTPADVLDGGPLGAPRLAGASRPLAGRALEAPQTSQSAIASRSEVSGSRVGTNSWAT